MRIFVAIIFGSFLGVALSAPAAELAAQKSASSGVTVTVTPQSIAADAISWEFKIALDTHSQALNDDLVGIARLIDGGGKQYAPESWQGAAPGGHHREGVLRFKALSPRPDAIELRIVRTNENAPRVFRWQLD